MEAAISISSIKSPSMLSSNYNYFESSLLLSLVRLIQPSLIFLFVLISLGFPTIKNQFQRILNPRSNHYDQLLPQQSDSDSGSTPEPTPVVVPFRTRRRFLTQALLLTTASTYFISGVLIILRAVLPPSRTWTPDLPNYSFIDFQSLFGLTAWIFLALACLIEEKQRGVQLYGRGKIVFSILIGAIGDVLILILQFKLQKDHEGLGNRWNLGQILLPFVRLLILYPLISIAIGWDKIKFVRPDQLPSTVRSSLVSGGTNPRNSISNLEAGTTTTTTTTTESTGLLHPNSAAQETGGGYGSTGTSTPTATSSTDKGKGKQTQNQSGSGTRSPARDANASMGLSVAAQPPPPTLKVFAQRLKVLFPYLWPSKSVKLQSLAAFCVVLLIAGRFVNLLVPITLGKIVDSLSETVNAIVLKVTTSSSSPVKDGAKGWLGNFDLWSLIFFYAGLKLLQGSGGLLTVIQNFAWLPVEQYSDRQMSLMAFNHLLNLSMAFHSKRKTGEVLRILDRGAAINNFFQYLIFSVVPIFVDIAVAMVYLTNTFSWMVGGSLFIVMYFYTYSSVKLTTWRTTLRRISNNKDSICRSLHTDCLLNYEQIKYSANERYEEERYRAALLDYQKAEYQVLASLNVLNLIQNFIISVGTLSTTLLVAKSVASGQTSASQFVVFITYLQQVYGPLSMLGTLYRVVQQNLVDTDKLMSLLEEETEIVDAPDAKDLVVSEGVIEFRDVHFSYDGRVKALSGVNFKIPPHSKFAVCGESGSGKSTILRLLFRFYDVQSGSILIDGQDIRKVTQKSLRQAIGIVPQDPSLFNNDIKHNILYGRVDASDEEVEAAAAAAQILDKIRAFPDQFSTVVGERGVKLSGGEKQRVAIARTILKNPPLLLLDEATSALDSQTEKQLQIALSTLLEGRTSLTIAHRLSTIINSDKIIVMDSGRVIEQGSHAELIQNQGVYQMMWTNQIKTQKEQEAMAREQEEQKAAADDSQSHLKPKINTDVASKQQQKQQQEDEEPKSPTAPAGFLGVVPPSMTGEESPVSPSKHEAMEEKKLVEESNQGQEEQQIKKEEESSQPYQVEPAPNRPQLPESKSSSSVKFPSPEAAEVDTLAPLPESTTAEESQVSEAPASIQEQNQDTSLTSDDKGSSSPRSNSIRKRIASLGSMMGSRRTPSTSSIPSTSNHQVESSEASTIQPGAAREREISQAGSETPSVSGEVGNGKKKKNKNKKKKGNGNKAHS